MPSRPEVQAPPEIFYSDVEAQKYTRCSRNLRIQSELSERALELLNLPADGVPRLLLDIGCGSGLSGEILSENEHHWIGLDISESMLNVALEREVDGDLILGDMGQGLGLRVGVIDGAISISAIQWLCNADKSHHDPKLRLKIFFRSLYRCLARGAKAVFQLYPENIKQRELIFSCAMVAGFGGQLLVDYPRSTKKMKEYLILTCGPPSHVSNFQGQVTEGYCPAEDNSKVLDSCSNRPRKRLKTIEEGRDEKNHVEWVLKKKEQQRNKGMMVPPDTRFTARKRKTCY